MKIVIEPHNDQYNIALASSDGKAPFLTIKGVRVVQGSRGPFLSWPARKMDNGKYFQHVWASEVFAEHVLKEIEKVKPAPKKAAPDDDSDIPF